jgi:hypothetical protein
VSWHERFRNRLGCRRKVDIVGHRWSPSLTGTGLDAQRLSHPAHEDCAAAHNAILPSPAVLRFKSDCGAKAEHRQERENPADDTQQPNRNANPAGIGVAQPSKDANRAHRQFPFKAFECVPQDPHSFGHTNLLACSPRSRRG